MAANYPLYETKTGVLIMKYVPFRPSKKPYYTPIFHSAPKSDKTAILLVYLLVPNTIFINLVWTFS